MSTGSRSPPRSDSPQSATPRPHEGGGASHRNSIAQPRSLASRRSSQTAHYHTKEQLQHHTSVALAQSVDSVLRGEVKRMREELTVWRKEAQRAKQLKDEVEFLRNVTLLQHEEKVPIRLRELERDNAALRKRVASLEEQVKSYEQDEYRQRLVQQRTSVGGWQNELARVAGTAAGNHGNADGNDARQGGGSGGVLTGSFFEDRSRDPSPRGRSGTMRGSPGAGPSNDSIAFRRDRGAEIIIRPSGGETCSSCRVRISALDRASRQERQVLEEELRNTQKKLDEANTEISAVQNWVKNLVANAHQYPMLALGQPSLSAVAAMETPNREHDPRSSLGTAYTQRHQAPAEANLSGLKWASAVAPSNTYLDAYRR